jgi:hypothetical protein
MKLLCIGKPVPRCRQHYQSKEKHTSLIQKKHISSVMNLDARVRLLVFKNGKQRDKLLDLASVENPRKPPRKRKQLKPKAGAMHRGFQRSRSLENSKNANTYPITDEGISKIIG